MSRRMTKPTKWHVCLGIRPVWSESLPSAWRNLGSLATHWAHSKDPDQTGGCPGWSESSLGVHGILLVCHEAAQIRNQTPEKITVIILKSEQCGFSTLQCAQKKQTKWKTVLTLIILLFRSSLIWVFSVCTDLSVQKLTIIIAFYTLTSNSLTKLEMWPCRTGLWSNSLPCISRTSVIEKIEMCHFW